MTQQAPNRETGPAPVDPAGPETLPPIRLEQVDYAVGDHTILHHVDLTVTRGEIFAVMGRSGLGKTTLLRLMMGLIRPQRGRVLVYGEDLARLQDAELERVRLKMGFIFQGAALFDSLTVGENVAIGLVEHHLVPKDEVAERVRHFLELVEVTEAERLRPAELSGGMRKRVGIARALAMEPEIILYDEPTAGLDPISASAVDSLIKGLRDRLGVTSVIVSHDVASLRRVCDRAALLHDARFLAVGSMAELEVGGDPGVVQFLAGNHEGPLTEWAHEAKG
jgi:phospholipid/cholesterol/gamma-HCH transport system ATP-binding protein